MATVYSAGKHRIMIAPDLRVCVFVRFDCTPVPTYHIDGAEMGRIYSTLNNIVLEIF